MGGGPTNQIFRVVSLGGFDAILGMGWLRSNQVHINSTMGAIFFLDIFYNRIEVEGIRGSIESKLAKKERMIKGARKVLVNIRIS